MREAWPISTATRQDCKKLFGAVSAGPAVCDFQSGNDGARFVDGFLIFALWDGIGDDATTGLNVGAAIFCDQSAQRDAGIEIAGKIEIKNGPGVNAAAGGLKFVNDLHGANFWRAGNGPGRKAGHERVETVETWTQFA